MREPTHEDIPYFIRAGRAFSDLTPLGFDSGSYAENVRQMIDSPSVIAVVDGDPVRAHCAAALTPSLYDASEVIARVYTTWGPGGLRCFREVEKRAKERGARFLIADSFAEPRVMKFYERIGMQQADITYIKEL